MPAICEVSPASVCDPGADRFAIQRRMEKLIRPTAVPIGAIRSLTTEVGAGRSVPGATAALGTPSLPKGPPGSVFALYVPNRQTLSRLPRTRALVFTFCLLTGNCRGRGRSPTRRLHLQPTSHTSAMSARLSIALIAAVAVVALGSALAGSAAPPQAGPVLACARVRLSLGEGGVGLTGGTIAYTVSLTNIGRVRCLAQGRPWVRVPPERYPVIVGDLHLGQYGGGPGHTLTLRPGERARAHVEMGRARCDFKKSNAGSLRVKFGWAAASVTTGGEACLDNGGVVLVGPFHL
jgi:hypothetical protein